MENRTLKTAMLIVAAAGTLLTTCGKAAEPASPGEKTMSAEPPKKFNVPVWHPDARWEVFEHWAAASAVSSTLDGPREEIMWRDAYGGDYDAAFTGQGWPSTMSRYDPKSDRIHTVAGSGRGLLDGPFSRARFGGVAYVCNASWAVSPDRRFNVCTDPGVGYAVRVLDFKEQMVRTIVPAEAGPKALVVNSKGEALVLLGQGKLRTLDLATGKQVAEIVLKATEGLDLGFGKGLALDENHNRLYASGTVLREGWHVWYFDLNDGGSFHGVLKGGSTGPNAGYAGPFDDYKGYPEQAVRFGPDDPDCRFLYMRVTDTGTFMRLDLERRIVGACSGAPRGKSGPVMFIEEGTPNSTAAHVGAEWLPNGDFITPSVLGRPLAYYRRIK